MVSKKVTAAKAPRSSMASSATKVKKQPGKDAVSEERLRRTAIAAYFRAEARGFAPGGEVEDWLAAERELELELSPQHSRSTELEHEEEQEKVPAGRPAEKHGTQPGERQETAPAGKSAQKRSKATRGAVSNARKQGDRS